ncbi:CpsB/CapC family capsule biosynthesis tyrosine phosphatase [Neobacillus sp. YIM B06451]|uniref:tyrosine-protein phosphatase n=1 Tax=Neobacillus sp. YIM B06451 TaxID=3070994 RepID=UPI00292D9243|nr:CpsB/CapC family capsule biosynthesis tyrosine phosphatase [Neobacillus sp. YIM B06451]
MIDIHCHILPGVDDGAKSIRESLEIARAAVSEGIKTIVATPHHKNNRYTNTKQSILEQVGELNGHLQLAKIPLTVLPGQEVRVYGELIEDYERNEILTLAETQYLFIEFPSDHVPRYTEKLIYNLQMSGLTPIIVHPERNQELIERPGILYSLVKNGALTQITASSLAGYFGKKIKNFSFQLIESNLTHFIASDAHNTHSRGFNMREAYEVLEDTYGRELSFILQENADLLLLDKNIYKEVPEPIKKKKIFGIF